jgi:hypothetical protein
MADGTAKPVIFISYSHRDRAWLDYVRSFLAPLAKQGTLTIWDDEKLQIGDDWKGDIFSALEDSKIFILLVSRHSLSSKFILNEEISRILSMPARNVHFYPIVVSPYPEIAVDWLKSYILHPSGGRSLSELEQSSRDHAMTLLVAEIAKILEQYKSEQEYEQKKTQRLDQERITIKSLSRAIDPAPGHDDLRVFAPSFSADRADSEVDSLNISFDVEAFAQLICLQATEPPLSIALFGSWGSGKTFFMERLLKRVDSLTKATNVETVAAKGAGDQHRFIKRVVQVRFNAWHYADANLWASLTAEFFDQLRAGGAGQSRVADYEKLVDQVARHLPSLEAEAVQKSEEAVDIEWKLNVAQRAADEARRRAGIEETDSLAKAAGKALAQTFEQHRSELKELGHRVNMDDLATNMESFSGAAREAATALGKLKLVFQLLRSGTPAAWTALAGLLLLMAILIAIPFADTTILATRIEQVQEWSSLPAIVAFATGIWKSYRFVRPILDGASAFSKNAIDAKRTLSADLVAHEAEVSALARRAKDARDRVKIAKGKLEGYAGKRDVRAPEAVLRYLLYDAAETAKYEEGLGIISRARRSFEKLDEIIRRSKERKGKDQIGSLDVPDRIILYIDDLDRCTHKQVYDVLQAVHLLLALESFIVIVGVDVRWIEGAIANHFEAESQANDLRNYEVAVDGASDAKNDNNNSFIALNRRTRALEYLEKIFQIPFWLRPISTSDDDTYGRFVSNLVAYNKPPTPLPPNYFNAGHTNENRTNSSIDQSGQPPLPPPDNVDVQVASIEALERIVLSEEEYNLIKTHEIGRIVGKSPRAVKRFVNIYQLVRSRRRGSDLAEFIGMGERSPLFPVAMLLLAIDVGQSADAARAFRNLISGNKGKGQTFSDVSSMAKIKSQNPKRWFANETGIDELDEAIARVAIEHADELLIDDWCKISDEIRRYSFNDPRAA